MKARALAALAVAAVATIGCSASHSDDLQSESSGAVLSSERVGTQADELGSELSPEMEKQVSTIADAFDEVERVGWSVDEGVSPIVQVGEDPHDWRVTIPMQRRLSEGERDAERGELVIAVSANGEVGINRPGEPRGQLPVIDGARIVDFDAPDARIVRETAIRVPRFVQCMIACVSVLCTAIVRCPKFPTQLFLACATGVCAVQTARCIRICR